MGEQTITCGKCDRTWPCPAACGDPESCPISAALPEPELATLDWDSYRDGFQRMAEATNNWQGIPIPLTDMRVVLHDRHPLRGFYDEQYGPDVQVLVGGPDHEEPLPDGADADALVGRALDADERCVNHWFDPSRNRDVYLYQRGNGRAFAFTVRRSPDSSMDRLTYWLTTMGAADAWDLEAEYTARVKLSGLVSERQFRQYDLTGCFLETSRRSGVTYLFRRLRPTIALTPRWQERGDRPAPDAMKCLAVLCLHPIGFYDHSWAGCMVPTDDVIAHVLLMRGDEAHFWRKANQHDASSPEAGL